MIPSHLPQHLTGVVPFTHGILRSALQHGGIAVDATAGNGHDTVLLADWVGPQGHIYAFDVQASALAQTQQRLQQADLAQRATLIHDSHAHLAQYVHQPVQAMVFNLGWLPGSDKHIATQPSSTVAALDAAKPLLAVHGVLVMVVYQGHAHACLERDAIEAWFGQLTTSHWHCVRYQLAHSTTRPAPFVMALERMR